MALSLSCVLYIHKLKKGGGPGVRGRRESDGPWRKPDAAEAEIVLDEESSRIKEQIVAKSRTKNIHVRVRNILLSAQVKDPLNHNPRRY